MTGALPCAVTTTCPLHRIEMSRPHGSDFLATTVVSDFFAGVAVILAAVGLYGVLAGVVRQRTAEIGVRMAFGAPNSSIFKQFIGQGLKLSVAGVVVGLVAAAGLTRWMASMLVGVTPTDPLTYAAIAVLFVAVALFACWLPARRAAALDPVVALRDE